MKEKIVNNEIRKAEKRDIPRMLELLVQVNHVHAVGRPDLFADGKTKYDQETLGAVLADPDRITFVCERAGQVIGYCMCMIERHGGGAEVPHTSLYIDDLCVDEAIRKTGAGTALYEYVKDFARKEGYYSLTLHVWECNPSARAFYDACGMVPYMTAMEEVL